MKKRIGSVAAVVATVALGVPSLAACEEDRRCVDAAGEPVAESHCEEGDPDYSWTRYGSRRGHRR
ncbi:hypothetical protein ABZ801_28575 [Actinomadura sp. NPDC047616]|uniref:hypothetical protein n=1 Tax=Actinomadura sp. NPDC047616 TaxID=3155914 RepID=UPI0034063686